ncbi:EAL domain-containing protein [Methylobacterium sp. C25]|uniref:EAL domain-containing protein n=1 Tax=Methylobacterium sp. C25 TaxID=2721622 RepID=UPI001F337AE3|nr:EAL domain-containing protein [Methylobacterium sp. C25]MCE4224059.1 EAL domain-containing protein [Methylobacterium sp. C25]
MRDVILPRLGKRQLRAHLLVASVVSLVVVSSLHIWLREAIVDARFRLATRPASGTVALIEIDPKSIDAVGHWPWRRTLHADLVRQLDKAGVADIAFDVDFSAPSSSDDDGAFAKALQEAGGSVILAAFRQYVDAQAGGSSVHVNRPIPPFLQQSWPALVDVRPDRDGVARSYDFGDRIDGTFMPSMGTLLAGRQEEHGPAFRIDFGIKPSTLPRVSFVDVLQGVPSTLEALKGKKVIVAGTAAELGDRLNVPNGVILPGSFVLALAAESVLQDRTLVLASDAVSIALVIGVMLLMAVAWRRSRVSLRIAVLAVLAIAIEGGAIALQSKMPVVLDTSLMLSACVAYAFAAMLDEIDLRGILRLVSERRFQRITLSLSDGMVCVDGNARITFWNPAASTIFKYDAKDGVGQRFDVLLETTDRAERFDLTAIPLKELQTGNGYVVELKGRRRDGEVFDLECSLSAWDTPGGIQYGAILRDISLRKQQRERIRFLAECDVLTGLPNRNSLLAKLEREIGNPQALLLVGVNRFGQINHLRGASFADALISAITCRLTALVQPSAFLARLSDGEFAIIVSQECDEPIGAEIIADFQLTAVAIDESRYRVSVSVGVAVAKTAKDRDEWLGNAQFALTAARLASKSEPMQFTSPMRRAIEEREALEIELRQALKRSEFELFYQPQIDLRSGRVIGAEALIRWRHPERGYVSPGEFIPVVNSTSLAEGVSAWVMDTAVRQTAVWSRAGHCIRIGINLAQCQFATGDLVAEVSRLLERHNAPPDLIELEVTEDIILDDAQNVNFVLSDLRSRSIKIAFDDFGTGYGSLTYLKKFSLDTIKIDQLFVRNLLPDSDDAAIVKATIDLGHALGLSVIAEGIETEAVYNFLRDLGCDEGQGYFIGRPTSAEMFAATFLAQDGHRAA